MIVLALMLGIISFCLSPIPKFGLIALLPCILSFIFSLIILLNKNITLNKKAMSITSIIISILSFVNIIFFVCIFSFLEYIGF